MSFRLTIFLFFISGCFKSQTLPPMQRVEVQTVAKEVKIPKIIMTNLEEELTKESKTIAPIYLFMPIEVQFNEASSGVLKHPHIRFNLPKGGGSLDLKNIISSTGSFYMSFPPEQFEDASENTPNLLHLYYISNSPIKKIDGENFGLGCGKIIDLKKSFDKLQESYFLKLNTSGLRYLYVTAGRYIFVFKQSLKVYMTQLTITDSRYNDELCMGVDY